MEGLDLLLRERALPKVLGENGRTYVRENYRWPAVLGHYRKLIDAVRPFV